MLRMPAVSTYLPRCSASAHRAAGFTLPEVLIATAVLAIAVAALTQAIVAGQTQTYDAMHRGRAIALAEAMLEEVLSKRYEDADAPDAPLGPDTGETGRDDFDDIDDYHGFTETAGELSDHASATYPQMYQRFDRSVTVVSHQVDIAPFGERDGLMIEVRVRDERGETWTVNRFVPAPSGGND
ncbi:MAG: type IV pilus modification PilV family protein [Phycisphaeraceae bacterium]